MAVWDFAGRLANLGVTFIVGVVLTRLLTPVEFGTFAIVVSVVSFSTLFVDLGFRQAIVQADEISQLQLSTVFYINVGAALVLIAIVWSVAGYVENFYQLENLRTYIVGGSVLFAINAAALVSNALLQKRLQFKKLSIINTVAAAFSGIIAIILAVAGYKVWALVMQQILSATVILAGVTIATRWAPSVRFSLASIKEMWSYGSRLFASAFADTLFTRMDVFIIGKLFPIQTLGFYNRAQSLDQLVRNFSANTTTSVAFPVIAKIKDDLERTRSFYFKCLHVIAFLSFLLIGVLFLTCFDIVIILFTQKWEAAGSFFRIMAVTGFVYPLSALMVNVLSARGKSGAYLKLELIKKALLFPAYLSFLFGGVYVFLITLSVAYLAALVANAAFVGAEIEVSVKEQFLSILKYAGLAVPVTAIVFYAGSFLESHYLHFFVCSIFYSICYVLFCFKLNLPGFREIFDQAMTLYNDKRNSNVSSTN
jgi:O-antigen/teichoic acid export membrane protein